MSGKLRDQSKVLCLQQLFKKKHEQGLFDGTILVAQHGEVLYADSFGWECREQEIPLSMQSRFELASLTKPLTAQGIRILIQKDMLKEDDPLQKWLPELTYPGITIKNLIQHTSGLPDYMELLECYWNQGEIAGNAEALRLLSKHHPPAYFAPGTQFSYSNTAYMCLASIVERASNDTFSDFMRCYVFEPIGMNDTHIINRRLQPEWTELNYAFGYIRMADGQLCLPDELPEFQYVYYLDGIQGDGTIHSTALDLLKLDQALRQNQDERWDEAKFSEPVFNGWFTEKNANTGRVLSHSGGWPGYSTRMCRYLDSGFTIILLCNVEPIDYRNRPEQPEDWQKQIEQILMF